MVKGLPVVSLLFTKMWRLCRPRCSALYDTSYREGELYITSVSKSGDDEVGVGSSEIGCR